MLFGPLLHLEHPLTKPTYTPLDFIWVLYDSLWPPWSSLHLMASGHFSKGPFTLKEPPMPKIEENVRRLRGMWRLSTKNYSHGHAFSITRCWQDQERIQQLQPTMFWRIAQKLLNGRPLYKRHQSALRFVEDSHTQLEEHNIGQYFLTNI